MARVSEKLFFSFFTIRRLKNIIFSTILTFRGESKEQEERGKSGGTTFSLSSNIYLLFLPSPTFFREKQVSKYILESIHDGQMLRQSISALIFPYFQNFLPF